MESLFRRATFCWAPQHFKVSYIITIYNPETAGYSAAIKTLTVARYSQNLRMYPVHKACFTKQLGIYILF
jgi:hypothetical protein